MLIDSKLMDIFFYTDEFYKDFTKTLEGVQLSSDNSKKSRNKPCTLSDSEVITILIAFHLHTICTSSSNQRVSRNGFVQQVC
jgi:hypothetical protein